MRHTLAHAGRMLPLLIAGAVVLGALRVGLVGVDPVALMRLCAETVLFAAGSVLLAWPLVSLRPQLFTGVIAALPPVTIGALAGLALRGMALSPFASWSCGIVVTALAITPRLGSELAVVAASTRRELVDAALALGASTRQAQRLAVDADGVGRRALLVALALAISEGVAALTAWRIAGVAHPLPASVALLQSNHGALLLIVLAAVPAALSHRGIGVVRAPARAPAREVLFVEVTR